MTGCFVGVLPPCNLFNSFNDILEEGCVVLVCWVDCCLVSLRSKLTKPLEMSNNVESFFSCVEEVLKASFDPKASSKPELSKLASNSLPPVLNPDDVLPLGLNPELVG